MPTTTISSQAIAAALERSFLSPLPEPAVSALLEGSVLHHYQSGTVVAEEGSVQSVGLVVDGLIRVFVGSADGWQVTVRHVRQGGVFGVGAIFGGLAVTNVHAIHQSLILELSSDVLRSMASGDPQVSWAVAHEAADRLGSAYTELVFLSRSSLHTRVARELLDLANATASGGGLEVWIHQDELAETLGTAREVVGRILAVMKREGLIQARPGTITIVDPARLRLVAGSNGRASGHGHE